MNNTIYVVHMTHEHYKLDWSKILMGKHEAYLNSCGKGLTQV